MRSPKALRMTLHVEGRTTLVLVRSSTLVCRYTDIHIWQLALVSSRKRINILHYPFLPSHQATFQ